MFPTLGHLFSYLTGIQFHLPIPTFGFFMALSFIGAWWAFRSEYKRKEAGGIIHPLMAPPKPPPDKSHFSSQWQFLAIGGSTGFIAGAKAWYAWTNRGYYIGTLPDFLFSIRGSLPGGIATGSICLLASWLYIRRRPVSRSHQDTYPQPSPSSLPPHQIMDRLLLYCGLSGFAGAILFAKIEGVSGLNYYGALIAGTLTYLYINWRQGIPLRIAADIGSPGMMLAYGLGRIGCHLAGDGDWGIVNTAPQPAWLQWAPACTWSCRFPHNSIHQGVYIPGCADNYCTVLPNPVYPTSLYEAVICIALFLTLWTIRRKIGTEGVMFAIYALLNGAERFTIEFIRVNPRYNIGGWSLSQAQFLAMGWICAGAIVLFAPARKITKKSPDKR